MRNQTILGRILLFIGLIILGSFIFSFLSSILWLVMRYFIPIVILVGIIYLVKQDREYRRY